MTNAKQRIIMAFQGAAGVGKTAVARKICRKLPGKTARVSVDVLRDMSCLNAMTQKLSDEYITMAKKPLKLFWKKLKGACSPFFVYFFTCIRGRNCIACK